MDKLSHIKAFIPLIIVAPLLFSYKLILVFLMMFISNDFMIAMLNWAPFIQMVGAYVVLISMGYYISIKHPKSTTMVVTIGIVFGFLFILTELFCGVISNQNIKSFYGNPNYWLPIIKRFPLWCCIPFIGKGLKLFVGRFKSIS